MGAPRILIVEDETIVAMDIAATLRRLGYEVAGMVVSGQAAIDAAATEKPNLILMDIRLKGPMDGIEAASAIHRQHDIPIVFLTAHGDVETVERSKTASPYAYLVKPFDERVLHRVVEVALHRETAERTAREQVLDALWHSEERFRLLVDAVKDYALFMLDTGGRIASWNSGAERMTGFPADDVIGRSVSVLGATEETPETLERQFTEIRDEGAAEWDQLSVRKDGSRYLAHVYRTQILTRSGELLGYVCVSRDVTEQRNLQAQVLQAQKLESLGALAGGVAHDFNNMLMVIFARCDLLVRSLESDKHRRYVEDIRAAAKKNRDLTQQLLAASRRQVMEPQVVDLNEVIRTAMQLLAPTLGEHITIQHELQEPLWNVHADPGKMHQVLVNLAINARDAMPRGGTLTIETRNADVDTLYARKHLGLRHGQYVSLVVSDTGIGIPPEIRDRIYDPFFTTKALGEGTGLGLAVVRGIVEQNGGLVWMYSEEGRGTTFKIFFPRDRSQKTPEPTAEEARLDRGEETILLVEDEEFLRAVIRETLEEQGYRVLEAATAADALTLSSAFGGRIDLLLTDVIMPGMTGKELAEAMTSQRPDMPIIFMSGYTNHTVMSYSSLPAGVRFLEKPIAASVLLRAVRDVLDERH